MLRASLAKNTWLVGWMTLGHHSFTSSGSVFQLQTMASENEGGHTLGQPPISGITWGGMGMVSMAFWTSEALAALPGLETQIVTLVTCLAH